MKRLALLAAAAGLLFPVGAARACVSWDDVSTLIHRGLPQRLPRGAVVAEVRFEVADIGQLYGRGVRVRVVRMIRGDYRGRTLIVRKRAISTCSDPFLNGRMGLIVAIPIGRRGGVPVVQPLEARRIDGFRLPEGYEPGPRDGVRAGRN